MKKIFTLLFAVGMLAFGAQAQPGQRDNRQFDQRNDQRYDQQYDQRIDRQTDQREINNGFENGRLTIDGNFSFGNDRGNGNSRFSNERKRDMQIARINQMFDYKIQRVKRSFYMDWFEKQRLVRSLEQQRQWEIRNVYAKFSDRNRYDDRNRGYGHNGGNDRDDCSNGHY